MDAPQTPGTVIAMSGAGRVERELDTAMTALEIGRGTGRMIV
jgi:hypothetical protein